MDKRRIASKPAYRDQGLSRKGKVCATIKIGEVGHVCSLTVDIGGLLGRFAHGSADTHRNSAKS